MMNNNLSKHFSTNEFMCHCGCGLVLIQFPLISILECHRNYFKVPMEVRSGTRCYSYNISEKVRSNNNSVHLWGGASDIRFKNIMIKDIKYDLIRIHEEKKYGGLGIYEDDNFAHIDCGLYRYWEA